MKKTPWFGGFRIDPWIQEYLAKTDMVPGKSDQDQVSREGVKPAAKKVLVHKLLEGPRADGSVVKEVSDGDVSVRAVFTPEALAEFAQGSEEDMTPPDWNKSLIILRKYSLRHQLADDLKKCVFEVVVDEFAFWCQLQGFKPKNIHIYCMQVPEVRLRSNVLWELNKHGLDRSVSASRNNPNSDDVSMGSIALTQLLAQMTQPDSQPSEETSDASAVKVCGGAMTNMLPLINSDLEPEDYLISSSQEEALDQIEEWKADYKPVQNGPSINSDDPSSSAGKSQGSSSPLPSANSHQVSESAVAGRKVMTPRKRRTKEELERRGTRSPSLENRRVASPQLAHSPSLENRRVDSPQHTSPEHIRNNVMAKLDNITALVSKVKRTSPKKTRTPREDSANAGSTSAGDNVNSIGAALHLGKPTLENEVTSSSETVKSADNKRPSSDKSKVDNQRSAEELLSQSQARGDPVDSGATAGSHDDEGLSSEARERLGLAKDIGDYMDSVKLDLSYAESQEKETNPGADQQQQARTDTQNKQNVSSGVPDNVDSDCDENRSLSSVRKSSIPEEALSRSISEIQIEGSDKNKDLDTDMEDAQFVIYTPEPVRSGMCTVASTRGDLGSGSPQGLETQRDRSTDSPLPAQAQSTQYDHISESQVPQPMFSMSPVRSESMAPDSQEEGEGTSSPRAAETGVESAPVSAALGEDVDPLVCEETRLGERLEHVRLAVTREDEEEEERLARMTRPTDVVELAGELLSSTAALEQAEANVSPGQPDQQQPHPTTSSHKDGESDAAAKSDAETEQNRTADTQNSCDTVIRLCTETSQGWKKSPAYSTQPFEVHSEAEVMSPSTCSDKSADLFGASVELTPNVIVISEPSSGQSGEDSSQVPSSGNSMDPQSILISSGQSQHSSQGPTPISQNSVVLTDVIPPQTEARGNSEISEAIGPSSTPSNRPVDSPKSVMKKSAERQSSSESKLGGSDELISSGEMNSCIPVGSSSDSRGSGESSHQTSEESRTGTSQENVTNRPVDGKSDSVIAAVGSTHEEGSTAEVDTAEAQQQEAGNKCDEDVGVVPSSVSSPPIPQQAEKDPPVTPAVTPSILANQLTVPPSPHDRDADADSIDTMSICSSESDRRSVRSNSSSTQVMRSTAVRVMRNVKEVSAQKGQDRKRRDTMSMISDVVGREHQASRRNAEVLFNLKKKSPARSGADVLGKPSQRRRRRALYQESVLLPLGESVLEESSTKSSKFRMHLGRSPSSASLGHSPGSGQASRTQTPSPSTSPLSSSRGHTPPNRTSPAVAPVSGDKAVSPSTAGQPPVTPGQATRSISMTEATPRAAKTPGRTTPRPTTPAVLLHTADTPSQSTPRATTPSVLSRTRTPSQPSAADLAAPIQTSTPTSVLKEAPVPAELNASDVVAGTPQNEEQKKVPKSKTKLLFKYPSIDNQTPTPAQESSSTKPCNPCADSSAPPACLPPSESPITGDTDVAAPVMDQTSESSQSRLSVVVDQSSSELAEPLISPPYSAAAITSPRSSQGSEQLAPAPISPRSSHSSEQIAASATSPRSSHSSEPALSSHSQPSQEAATDSELDAQRNVIIDTIKRLNSISSYPRVPSNYSQTMRRKGSMDSVDSLVLVPKNKTPKSKGKTPQILQSTSKSPQVKSSPGNKASAKVRRERAAKRNRKIIIENSDSESDVDTSPVKTPVEQATKRRRKTIIVDSDISDSDTSHLQVKITKGDKTPSSSKTKGGASKTTTPRKRGRPVSPATISLSDDDDEEEEEEEEDDVELHGNMEKLELCILQHSERLNRQQRALKEMTCPKFYKDIYKFYKNTDFS